MPKSSARQLSDSVQIEIDAQYLYRKIAEAESDEGIAKVFLQLSEIEGGHADKMIERLRADGQQVHKPQPSWRAHTLDRIGRWFGYDYVIGVMMDTEKGLAQALVKKKSNQKVAVQGDEGNHVKILQALISNQHRVSGEQLSRIEGRHKSVGGNALRAAVLGANDGLVSNMSLVMGVAGATSGQSEVLLAGSAGLLAGALSMALGEWISVKSSQELYEKQMALEMDEIESNPEGERQEIALIYMAKGIPEDQAHDMAAEIMADQDKAHELLIKEELGINPEELKSSAWEAAITSFILFAIGAVIPLAPFFWSVGNAAILLSIGFSTVGLFLIGASITLFTGRSVWYSGFRQVIFGLLAAAITFGIGKWIGVSIAG
ncbi:MAG TPA: VIT1/CCC1 transporter family protein [Saprospiraceae bacterium]|nr:VIT1/CCC1 transporter family protein [Saprospiraceae bacterium]